MISFMTLLSVVGTTGAATAAASGGVISVFVAPMGTIQRHNPQFIKLAKASRARVRTGSHGKFSGRLARHLTFQRSHDICQ